MSYHADLLEQAIHLAKREPKKPRQASLRRAVSSAYYALFHLLIDEGARSLSPTGNDPLRQQIKRAFAHGDMVAVCKGFVAGHKSATLNKQVSNPPVATRRLVVFPLNPDLVSVLETFIELQDARHQADYDLSRQWNRMDVLNHVGAARQALKDWQAVRKNPETTVLLAALLLQKHWLR